MIYNTSKEYINDIKQRIVDRWVLGAITTKVLNNFMEFDKSMEIENNAVS